MLNKELLLASTKKDKEYTHIITVGMFKDDVGFNTFDGYGSITPTEFLGETLQKVYTEDRAHTTYVGIGSLLTTGPLFVARRDTKEVVWLDSISTTTGTASGWARLFTSLDLGKTIEIWIGENPPPLGLEIFLRRFLKEALYVK